MDIEHLREFVDLAHTLKFSTTAQHFFVSISVISRHIASIEGELGVTLFDRGTRSVTLTSAGEIFLENAKAVVNEYDNGVERLAHMDGQTTAVVHVGYLHNAARPFIATFARYMRDQYPQIGVVLLGMKYRELYTALDDHTADLNFMLDAFPSDKSEHDKRKVYDDDLYVVANLDSPLAQQRGGVRLADLAGQPIMMPDENAYPGLGKRIRSMLAAEPRIESFRSYIDIETLYLEVELGSCIGISSGFNRSLYGDRVAFIPILDADTHIEVSAFWRHSLHGEALRGCMEAVELCGESIERWQPGDVVAKPF